MSSEREKQDERRSNARSWAEKDDSKYASTVVKFPNGVTSIKMKPGIMNLDVIEYVVGKNNPECDEGMLHFELTYYVHRVPSADGTSMYPCLWEQYKRQCPICDWMRENQRTADPELLKSMRVNTRHLMNCIDLGTRDQKMQILDVNHYNKGMGFGEQLKNAIRAVPQFASFAQYDAGHTLTITVAEQPMGNGRKYSAASRIDFVPRALPYGRGILGETVNLEECLIQYEYDELKRLFLQMGPGAGAPPAAVAQPPASPPMRNERPSDRYSQGNDQPPPTQRYAPPPQEAPPQHSSRYSNAPPPPPTPPVTRESPRYQDAPPAPPVQAPASPPIEAPVQEKKREPVASDYGMKVRSIVDHPRLGKCEIVRISPDGTSLTIEDRNGMEYRSIGPHEVTLDAVGTMPPAGPTAPPAQSAPQPAPTPERRPETPPVAAPSRGGRYDDDFDRRPAQPTAQPQQNDPRRRD